MVSSQRMEKGWGSSQRMEKGWGVLTEDGEGLGPSVLLNLALVKFKCDPPNRDLVN